MSSVPSVGSRAAAAPAAAAALVGRRSPRRALGAAALAAAGFAILAVVLSSGLGLVDVARWAAAQQRAFHAMVGELLVVGREGALASAGLLVACLVYGFAHAAVPGHGKFLIAGAGMGSRISATQLVLLSLAASLAQAASAIALVYGSFALLDITAGWAMRATDRVLVPLSYVAIVVIGLVLVRRALAGLRRGWARQVARRAPASAAACDAGAAGEGAQGETACEACGHRHAPTARDVEALRSWRDALLLVASIGLRPCTGAVFVLVAAWRMNLVAVGAGAAVAMAVGTGAFVSLVAVSSATARGATVFAAGARHAALLVPLLQLAAGVAILLVGTAFLAASVLPGL